MNSVTAKLSMQKKSQEKKKGPEIKLTAESSLRPAGQQENPWFKQQELKVPR